MITFFIKMKKIPVVGLLFRAIMAIIELEVPKSVKIGKSVMYIDYNSSQDNVYIKTTVAENTGWKKISAI